MMWACRGHSSHVRENTLKSLWVQLLEQYSWLVLDRGRKFSCQGVQIQAPNFHTTWSYELKL